MSDKNYSCSRHDCVVKGNSRKCRYCGIFFCKKHIHAKLTSPAPYDYEHEDGKYVIDWRDPKGHPCPKFVSSYELKKEKDREKNSTVVSDFLEKSRQFFVNRNEYLSDESKPIIFSSPKNDSICVKSNFPSVLIIAVILVCSFIYLGNNPRTIDEIKEMIDDAVASTKSIEMPKTFGSSFLETGVQKYTPPATAAPLITFPETDFFDEPSIGEIEQLTYQKVNAIRGSNLKWNAQLATLARKHSEDMAIRDFFDHVNPDGDGPTERAKKMGIKTEVDKGIYISIGIGENISLIPTGNVIGCGYVYTAEEIAECAAEGWRESPGHYANIIDKEYVETGLGVGYSGSTYYLTQDFR